MGQEYRKGSLNVSRRDGEKDSQKRASGNEFWHCTNKSGCNFVKSTVQKVNFLLKAKIICQFLQ